MLYRWLGKYLWPQYGLFLWELCNLTSTHCICSCQLYEYSFSDCSPFLSTQTTPNSWWRTALLFNFKSVTWLSAFTHDSDTQCRSALACLWPYVSFNWWVDSKNMFWGLRLGSGANPMHISISYKSLKLMLHVLTIVLIFQKLPMAWNLLNLEKIKWGRMRIKGGLPIALRGDTARPPFMKVCENNYKSIAM